ncbi:MAG: YbgC/FadM family acyl-CoA thioesterase [Betaproteobacteria bacterium]|nr:YbgC/FadM family acyl-CoA thioesterase [Betaproteobacteria bacterium]
MNPVSEPPRLPERRHFRCLDPLRVRWAEVDLQQIVFNGHYLMYFDTAVAAYWRQMAMPYHEAMNLLSGDLYVRKATLEYEASARYDEQLHIGIRLQRLGTSSMTFQACAFKGQGRLVYGEIVYVFADPKTQTSRPIPGVLRDWMLAFEEGQAMVSVQEGDWAALQAQARPIRQSVFEDEQGVPRALEQDGLDEQAHHVLARNRLGQALGTGRLLPLDARRGKIGRMAVMPMVRGAAVGQTLLSTLCDRARTLGLQEVVLHAQAPVVNFYRRAGFELASEAFEEAGLQHHLMRRSLVSG